MPFYYAIFGGSFNPIHQGHVTVVDRLLQLGIDKIFVIPTSRSPFKKQQLLLPNMLRFEMVQRTFQHRREVLVSDFEIKNTQVTYTYYTVKHLHIQYPGVIWHLVLGWDAYQDFPHWKEAYHIVASTTLWIVQRSGLFPESQPFEWALLPELEQWFEGIVWDSQHKIAYHQGREVVRYLDFQTPRISSTDIRSGQVGLDWIPSEARRLYSAYLHNQSRKSTKKY